MKEKKTPRWLLKMWVLRYMLTAVLNRSASDMDEVEKYVVNECSTMYTYVDCGAFY